MSSSSDSEAGDDEATVSPGSQTDDSDMDTGESMASRNASSEHDGDSEAGDGESTSTSWQTALRVWSQSLHPRSTESPLAVRRMGRPRAKLCST